MSFFKNLFKNNSPKFECPRCLGKGFVDERDIIRLNKSLKWKPGSCAYCNGAGKVKKDILNSIPADTTYLTTDLSAFEVFKLRYGNHNALDRAKKFDIAIENIIDEIKILHFEENLQIDQIANHYFSKYPEVYNNEYQKKELIDYIKEVVQHFNK